MWGWGYLYFQLQLLLHSYLYYLGSRANIGAKLLSMGDWEKANRMSCWQAIVRTVYLNQRGVITVPGMSSHRWKILISTQFCRRPPEPGAWSYTLLGDEAGLAKAMVFSIFSTLPWSYSCSVWVWNCSFKQMKQSLTEKTMRSSSQLVTHLGTSSAAWGERRRVTAAKDQTRRIHYR